MAFKRSLYSPARGVPRGALRPDRDVDSAACSRSSSRTPGACRSAGRSSSSSTRSGKPVTAPALKGKPSLVFFGFTHCPDVCPTTLYEISQVYDVLGPKGDKVKSFFITVDPERDTPDLLKTYLSSFDPRIVSAHGRPAAIDAAEKAYRVYAKKVPLDGDNYTMDHTALVYLMDRKGASSARRTSRRQRWSAASKLQQLIKNG